MKGKLASIIIPVKKINNYLRKETIPALLRQTEKNFEILVLTDRESHEKFPKTRIISTWPKTGPADKRDIGAKEAKGKILAFLDDDSYPDTSWLKNALDVFKQKKAYAGVCGPSLTPKSDNLSQKASGYVWSSWLGSGGAGNYRATVSPRRFVDDYPTVNLLVRKNDFWQVGGFESRFWPGEDTKLCNDLVYCLGKKIVYDPNVVVYHHRRPIFGPHLSQISRYAIHRGYFARTFPKTSFRLGYFLPSLFALGFISGPLLGIIIKRQHELLSSFVFYSWFFFSALYLILLLITIAHIYYLERRIKLSLLSGLSIFTTHLVYGFLFLKGFFTLHLES